MENVPKKSTGMIITIVVFGLLVVGIGGYFVYDKVLNKDNDSKENWNNINSNITNLNYQVKELASGIELNSGDVFFEGDWLTSELVGNKFSIKDKSQTLFTMDLDIKMAKLTSLIKHDNNYYANVRISNDCDSEGYCTEEKSLFVKFDSNKKYQWAYEITTEFKEVLHHIAPSTFIGTNQIFYVYQTGAFSKHSQITVSMDYNGNKLFELLDTNESYGYIVDIQPKENNTYLIVEQVSITDQPSKVDLITISSDGKELNRKTHYENSLIYSSYIVDNKLFSLFTSEASEYQYTVRMKEFNSSNEIIYNLKSQLEDSEFIYDIVDIYKYQNKYIIFTSVDKSYYDSNGEYDYSDMNLVYFIVDDTGKILSRTTVEEIKLPDDIYFYNNIYYIEGQYSVENEDDDYDTTFVKRWQLTLS